MVLSSSFDAFLDFLFSIFYELFDQPQVSYRIFFWKREILVVKAELPFFVVRKKQQLFSNIFRK